MIFFTATAKNWQTLFEDDRIKEILINSMEWLVKNNKAKIHSFVIMPNHVHIIWSSLDVEYDLASNFKSFTASMIKKHLLKNDVTKLKSYRSTQNDREYNFWKRRSKSIEIMNRSIAAQKIKYIHNNPLQEKWKLVILPEEYYYSSAGYYLYNKTDFEFLTRYEDWI
jgi:REP element-mobilizing transposase RayT